MALTKEAEMNLTHEQMTELALQSMTYCKGAGEQMMLAYYADNESAIEFHYENAIKDLNSALAILGLRAVPVEVTE